MTYQTFPAKVEALSDVLGFVDRTLESYECPMKIQTAICVAIEEVFVNVAHYAYGDGEGDMVLGIGFDEESRNITFRMTDKGIPFDPLKKPDPDITLSAEDREIGGLGIFITKKTMDTVTYAYENGKFTAAICAGPTVLADLGIPNGKHATCYPGCEENMGSAIIENAASVRDGKVITGTSAGSATAFGLSLIRALRGEAAANTVAEQIVIRTQEVTYG